MSTDTETKPVPPQTPDAAARALAVRQESAIEVAQDMAVTQMLGRDDRSLERIETVMVLPPDYMYAIEKRKPTGTDSRGKATGWRTESVKIGILADGYEYLNRSIGTSFFLPERVPSRKGTLEYNPIIERDYIRMRIGGLWYTPLGQAVLHIEDVEVDFGLVYIDKRANAKSAKVELDSKGQPVFDELGNPVLILTPEDNLKVIRELTRMRAYGPRYAITVGRVRLLKMASGLRSLPSEGTTSAWDWNAGRLRAIRVRVTGYRDKMTAFERLASVGQDLKTLFGVDDPDQLRQVDDDPNLAPLTRDEAAEVGLNVEQETEQVTGDQVVDGDEEEGETVQAPASAKVVGPDAEGVPAGKPGKAEPFTDEDMAEVDAEAERLGL